MTEIYCYPDQQPGVLIPTRRFLIDLSLLSFIGGQMLNVLAEALGTEIYGSCCPSLNEMMAWLNGLLSAPNRSHFPSRLMASLCTIQP